MRWTSFALVAAGIAAITAASYFVVSGSDGDRVVLASQNPTSTPTAILRATATSTATAVPTPAEPAAQEEAPPPEAPVESQPEPASQPAPTATAVRRAPTATPVVVVTDPVAIAPPAPTATSAPPPPPPPPTSTPVPPPPPPPAAPASFGALEQQLFAAHNAERAAAGLPPFQSDAALSNIARIRATDMATNNYFSHTSPSGQTAFSLLNSSGYRYSLGGENLARNNYPDGQAVSMAMSGLMGSATHRANVLNPAFRNAGIAMVVAADGMKYFVIVYAAP